MKEPYGEGVAIHTDPESCGDDSNDMAEALTGVHAGRVLSRESVRVQGAHVVDVTEGPPASPELAMAGRQHRVYR